MPSHDDINIQWHRFCRYGFQLQNAMKFIENASPNFDMPCGHGLDHGAFDIGNI